MKVSIYFSSSLKSGFEIGTPIAGPAKIWTIQVALICFGKINYEVFVFP